MRISSPSSSNSNGAVFLAVAVAWVTIVANVVNTSEAFSFSQQHQQQPKMTMQLEEKHCSDSCASSSTSRRVFWGKVSGSVAATFVALQQPANAALKSGQSNPFTGDYEDPNHPGCLRQVKVVGAPLGGSGIRSQYPIMEIIGWDGNDENSKACKVPPPNRDVLWQVKGVVKTNSDAYLDFSFRGGDDNVLARYENGGIVFPDGNRWKKIAEDRKRRPKDMTTLRAGPAKRERDDDDDED